MRRIENETRLHILRRNGDDTWADSTGAYPMDKMEWMKAKAQEWKEIFGKENVRLVSRTTTVHEMTLSV